MFKIIGGFLLLIGICLGLYSTSLNAYTDKEAFDKKTFSIRENEHNTEEYYKLREEYITPKYELQDYGITLMVLGVFLLVFFPKQFKDFKSPKEKWVVKIIGALAVVLSTIGFAGYIIVEASRDVYPPWADSIGIAFMSVPILFLVYLGWYGLNLIGLRNTFRLSVPIMDFRIRSTHYWYLSLFVLSVIIVILSIYHGDYWYTTSGILWAYFYLSLQLGNQKDLR